MVPVTKPICIRIMLTSASVQDGFDPNIRFNSSTAYNHNGFVFMCSVTFCFKFDNDHVIILIEGDLVKIIGGKQIYWLKSHDFDGGVLYSNKFSFTRFQKFD